MRPTRPYTKDQQLGRTKDRKQHPQSLIHRKDGTCYLCMKLYGDYTKKRVQQHHIFPGVANRTLSEQYGLTCWLCIQQHHESGPEAVHNNARSMRILQRDAQKAFEKYHTRAEWMDLFGRNYLENE